MRSSSALLALAVLFLGWIPAAAAAPPEPLPGRYIVSVADNADPQSVAADYARNGARVDFVYRSAARGFAGHLPAGLVRRLADDPRIDAVEADGIARTSDVVVAEVQHNPPWGLDRIDQRDRPLDKQYTYGYTGSGVRVYIVDTGISPHSDFGGRLATGFSAVNDKNGTTDCNGHGTHVAGTVGGTTHGVAKAVTLVPVRVLGCNGSGSWSQVIAGIDWVTAQPGTGKVANMSLSGNRSAAADAAVQRSIEAGVVYAVAAGNNGADACSYSPARVPEAFTAGAVSSTDTRASWSNFGACVDLFAPGVSVVSTAATGGTTTKSGTSMASPHVAGALALVLDAGLPASAVRAHATLNRVVGAGDGSPNRLLYTGFLVPPPTDDDPGDPPPGDPETPTALSASAACVAATCTFSASPQDLPGTYRWTFGDGRSGTGAVADHTYSKPGSMKATVTVGTASASTTVSCGWAGKGKDKNLACG